MNLVSGQSARQQDAAIRPPAEVRGSVVGSISKRSERCSRLWATSGQVASELTKVLVISASATSTSIINNTFFSAPTNGPDHWEVGESSGDISTHDRSHAPSSLPLEDHWGNAVSGDLSKPTPGRWTSLELQKRTCDLQLSRWISQLLMTPTASQERSKEVGEGGKTRSKTREGHCKYHCRREEGTSREGE